MVGHSPEGGALHAEDRTAYVGGVKGPGESSAADGGLAGDKSEGVLGAKGTVLRRVPEDQLVDALFEEIDKL